MSWRCLMWVIVVICTNALIAQSSIHDLNYRLDTIVSEGIDSMAFPGAQILIRHKDEVIYHRVWGHHTYDNNRKVGFEDIYDMASITKVSTGLPIIMKLYGEGRLDIDTPLSQYIDVLRRGNKKDITLRQVLTHQARLKPYIVFWQKTIKKNGKYKCRTFSDKLSSNYPVRITNQLYLHKNYKKKMHKAIRKSELRDEGAYLYSGLIFLLMPDMIEEIVGVSFETYLRKHIYDPIGAKSLRYNPLDHYPADQIVPTEYDTVWRHELIHGTVHDEAAAMLGGVSCNAGLFGNAEDLSKLFQLYLNRGSWEGEQLIHPESVDIFAQYQYVGNRRGLGLDKPLRSYDDSAAYIAESASEQSYGHSGFTGTFVWADPKYDLVVVFLSNRVHPSRSHRKLYSMSIRPRFHQAIYDYVMAQ